MPKITKKFLEGIKRPEDGQIFIRDTEIPGFGVRSTSSSISFILEKRIKGKPKRLTLGRYSNEFTVEKARNKAMELCGKIAQGIDPTQEDVVNEEEMTLEDLCEMYLEKHAKVRKKSWKNDRNQIKTYLSDWNEKKLSEIERKDVTNLHFKVGRESGHYAANRVVALLRKMFNLAEKWGLYKSENPATKIELFRESKRDRFIKPDELPRLVEAMKTEPNLFVQAALFTMLLTGQRKMEVLGMAWEDVDLNQGTWRIPETKTGDSHYVPLPQPVRDFLRSLPMVHNNPFVFCGRGENHLVSIEKNWRTIRTKAGLPDVRIHDLRRTLGSWLAGAGASLPLIGRVLHHSQPSTTQVYARFDLAPIRAALERNAERMLLIAQGKGENNAEEKEVDT